MQKRDGGQSPPPPPPPPPPKRRAQRALYCSVRADGCTLRAFAGGFEAVPARWRKGFLPVALRRAGDGAAAPGVPAGATPGVPVMWTPALERAVGGILRVAVLALVELEALGLEGEPVPGFTTADGRGYTGIVPWRNGGG
jgi:hypothetical protein